MTDDYSYLILDSLAAETEAIKKKAALLKLPDDISSFILLAINKIEEFPYELPQKKLLKKLMGRIKKSHEEGNIEDMRIYFYHLDKNFENAKHDKWVLGVEKQYGKNADRQRQRSIEITRPKHEYLRKLDKDIQSESTRPMSILERSRKIKVILDKAGNGKSMAIETIRKIIS